jgi:hypothetical protein
MHLQAYKVRADYKQNHRTKSLTKVSIKQHQQAVAKRNLDDATHHLKIYASTLSAKE